MPCPYGSRRKTAVSAKARKRTTSKFRAPTRREPELLQRILVYP